MHSTGKSLAEHGDKVSAADKSAIEAAIADVKSSMDSEDAEVIKTKTNTLAQAAMKLGEALYKAQAAGGDTGGAPGTPEEDVLDADFEEVQDDDNKP